MEILIILFVVIISFSFIRKKNPSVDNISKKRLSYKEMRDAIGITLSDGRQKEEDQKYYEISEKTIADIEASGYFKPDYLPIIAKKIREKTKAGYRYTDPFDKKDWLKAKEKRELGLDPKKSYTWELLEALSEKGLATEEPTELVKNIWQANFHKTSRQYDLRRFKKLGVKYVKICTCEDTRDCKAIQRFKKRWPIDEVPELPLPICNAKYCRCRYAMDDKLEDLRQSMKKH